MFSGEKKLFRKQDVKYIHVSHYEELSVKNMWDDLKGDEAFNVYFHEEYAKDRRPCRKYFFDILNTVHPFYLNNVMEHATKERFTAQGEQMKNQKINATEEWFKEL